MNILVRYIRILQHIGYCNQRLPRNEFWIFMLVNIFILKILWMFYPLNWIVALVVTALFLLAASKRLADVGMSKKHLWVLLIPGIGQLLMFVWLCLPSYPATNYSGPCPS